MARPKKGEKGNEEANNKWRATMLKRFGGEEGLHRKMQHSGSLGGKSGCGANYTGGFASRLLDKEGLTGPERARKYGIIGGRKSKRGPAKKKDDIDIEAVERVLEEEMYETTK